MVKRSSLRHSHISSHHNNFCYADNFAVNYEYRYHVTNAERCFYCRKCLLQNVSQYPFYCNEDFLNEFLVFWEQYLVNSFFVKSVKF